MIMGAVSDGVDKERRERPQTELGRCWHAKGVGGFP